jgi:hypothetical protein
MCSTGQHCQQFLRVLYDALIRLGYDMGHSSLPLLTVHGPLLGQVRG